MSKKDKLISRLRSKPKDFTFDEAKSLLELIEELRQEELL